ncbi:MAG: hypothetical protein LAT82_00450 [Nanoarchaeota archaeon]|nr:hypothetical protein [Nanoarchaeota archaeon]
MKSHNYLIKKKALLPYFPLVFIFTLIGAAIIVIAVLNNESERQSSLYLTSLNPHSELKLKENDARIEILKINSDVQIELLRDLEDEINIEELKISYINKVEEKIERFFRDYNFRIDAQDNLIYIEFIETNRNLKVTKNITTPIFYFKDEFILQLQELNSLHNVIHQKMIGIEHCYQTNPYNGNLCLGRISQEISQESDEELVCSLKSAREIECIFRKTPFTSQSFEVTAIQRQEDRRELGEIENLIIVEEITQELVINTNRLFTDINDLQSYFILLKPDEMYNLERAVNIFEETFKNGINQNIDNLNYISFETIEEIFGNFITNSGENRVYEIELEEITLYLKIVENPNHPRNNELSFIPLSLIISNLNNFPSLMPESIFIIDNRYFEDTSMLSRGSIIEIP